MSVRGAAMVEGVVVVAFLVVIWGAMSMAYTAGRAKLEAGQAARVQVMYYASHDCKHELPNLPPGQLPSTQANGGNVPAQNPGTGGDGDAFANGAPVPAGDPGARQSFFFASAEATRTATIYNRSTTSKSESWAVCNETAYPGNLIGFFQYGYSFFKSILPGPLQSIAP